MSDWQPIETAPKDGTAIWLLLDNVPYIGYGEPEIPVFDRKSMWFIKAGFRRKADMPDEIFGTYAYDVHPTHWMPLPEPPK